MYLTLLILDIVVFYEECFCIPTVHHCSTHSNKSQVLFAKMTKNCNLQIEKWGIFFKIRFKYDKIWLCLGVAQLVARAVRDCEVVGSNPITQTTKVLLTQNGRRSFGQKPQRLRLQIRSPRPISIPNSGRENHGNDSNNHSVVFLWHWDINSLL